MTAAAGAWPVARGSGIRPHPARPAAAGGVQAGVTLEYTWLNSFSAMNASADPAAPASNASARPRIPVGRRPGTDVLPERAATPAQLTGKQSNRP